MLKRYKFYPILFCIVQLEVYPVEINGKNPGFGDNFELRDDRGLQVNRNNTKFNNTVDVNTTYPTLLINSSHYPEQLLNVSSHNLLSRNAHRREAVGKSNVSLLLLEALLETGNLRKINLNNFSLNKLLKMSPKRSPHLTEDFKYSSNKTEFRKNIMKPLRERHLTNEKSSHFRSKKRFYKIGKADFKVRVVKRKYHPRSSLFRNVKKLSIPHNGNFNSLPRSARSFSNFSFKMQNYTDKKELAGYNTLVQNFNVTEISKLPQFVTTKDAVTKNIRIKKDKSNTPLFLAAQPHSTETIVKAAKKRSKPDFPDIVYIKNTNTHIMKKINMKDNLMHQLEDALNDKIKSVDSNEKNSVMDNTASFQNVNNNSEMQSKNDSTAKQIGQTVVLMDKISGDNLSLPNLGNIPMELLTRETTTPEKAPISAINENIKNNNMEQSLKNINQQIKKDVSDYYNTQSTISEDSYGPTGNSEADANNGESDILSQIRELKNFFNHRVENPHLNGKRADTAFPEKKLSANKKLGDELKSIESALLSSVLKLAKLRKDSIESQGKIHDSSEAIVNNNFNSLSDSDHERVLHLHISGFFTVTAIATILLTSCFGIFTLALRCIRLALKTKYFSNASDDQSSEHSASSTKYKVETSVRGYTGNLKRPATPDTKFSRSTVRAVLPKKNIDHSSVNRNARKYMVDLDAGQRRASKTIADIERRNIESSLKQIIHKASENLDVNAPIKEKDSRLHKRILQVDNPSINDMLTENVWKKSLLGKTDLRTQPNMNDSLKEYEPEYRSRINKKRLDENEASPLGILSKKSSGTLSLSALTNKAIRNSRLKWESGRGLGNMMNHTSHFVR